jgi:signal transduction histidine kinase
MNSLFLCGVSAAWAVAQVALGGFFTLAYLMARRSTEYLLFGLLCFALAVLSIGLSSNYASTDVMAWESRTTLAMAGVIAATALNLHFVMRYAGVRWGGRVVLVTYVISAANELLNAFGGWRIPGTARVRSYELFGYSVTQVGMRQSLLATSFQVFALATLLLCFWLLLRVYRSGRTEALTALLGSAVIPLAALHDVLLLWRVGGLGVTVLPHAFMVYAFAVATTLLIRYRQTAGQLETTQLHLRLRTEELERSYQDLETMEHQLVKQQLLASVGELSAAIAHEVRNPLAVIVNAVAGLRRPALRSEDRDVLLGIVDEETARLDRLVSDLLRFARPVKVARSEVSLTELIQQVLSGLDEKYRTRLSISPQQELETVFVDAGLLKLVLDSLLDNACQAMPDGGTVSVSAQPATLQGTAAVCLRVTDRGHGMDARTRERATKPFFTTRPTGTGLGLAIVERIVQAHGGDLGIASEPGQGTTVSVLIPRGDPRSRGRRRLASGAGLGPEAVEEP